VTGPHPLFTAADFTPQRVTFIKDKLFVDNFNYNERRIWDVIYKLRNCIVHNKEADLALSEEQVAEAERAWKNNVDDCRRKKVEHIIAMQTAQGATLDQRAKDSIKNNIMSKPYPQHDWEAHLFKEKKAQLVKDIVRRLIGMLEHSPLTTWNYREYIFFKEHWQHVLNSKQVIMSDKEFLGAKLQDYYQRLVFEHRNKTAHNTGLYLKDVPTLDTLADKGYVYKNYFFRFAILILIDEIFMLMFKRYRELGMKTI
jgi:hypothetical protein